MLTQLKRAFAKLVSFLSGGRSSGGPPVDPYARVTAPRRKGPNDRSSAVAVLEPDDEE